MNERIRELANEIWAEEYWDHHNTDKLLPAQLNRFAELIVRECLHLSNPLVEHYIYSHDEQDQVFLLAAIADYTSEIKKHFGIEE